MIFRSSLSEDLLKLLYILPENLKAVLTCSLVEDVMEIVVLRDLHLIIFFKFNLLLDMKTILIK